MIAEYDGSGTLQKKYVYGPFMDEALIVLDSSNNKTYLHHDRQGSVVATSNSSGAKVNSYAYSPFGEAGALSGTTFGYTGQRYDSETGLYYYKNRHYSPALGRFLQPDLIGYGDGLNVYQYAHNDPQYFRDPLGLAADGGYSTSDTGSAFGTANGSEGSSKKTTTGTQQTGTPDLIFPPNIPPSVTWETMIFDLTWARSQRDSWNETLGPVMAEYVAYQSYFNSVKTGGEFDYKTRFPKTTEKGLRDSTGHFMIEARVPYEDFGNFFAGAIAYAYRIPIGNLIAGGGIYSSAENAIKAVMQLAKGGLNSAAREFVDLRANAKNFQTFFEDPDDIAWSEKGYKFAELFFAGKITKPIGIK